MDKIYILRNKRIMQGPYSLEQLEEKGLLHDDMVWYDGLQDWVTVDAVPELLPFLKSESHKHSGKNSSSFISRIKNFLK